MIDECVVRRRVHDRPNFQRYMPLHRIKYTRSLVKYAKADMNMTVADPWAWLFRGVVEFHLKRAAVVLAHGVYASLNATMSAFQPRKEKLGGLPNISYVHRKPKPLGTEFKTVCDCDTGSLFIWRYQRARTRCAPTRTRPSSAAWRHAPPGWARLPPSMALLTPPARRRVVRLD